MATTQKKITIIALLVFLIAIGGLFAAYRYYTKEAIPDGRGGTGLGGGGPILFGSQSDPLNGADLGTTTPDGAVVIPRLRRISIVPVAGGTIFDTESETLIRYVERATGHIFETSTTTLSQRRIVNTTVPRIQETVWTDDGNGVILRYLTETDVIKSFYTPMPTEGSANDGVFLRNAILQSVAEKGGDSVFSLVQDGTGTVGFISDPDGANERTLFTSPIRDWTGQWVSGGLYVATKPSAGIEGHVFNVSTQSGALSKIFSASGVIALPNPDGSLILFSSSTAEGATSLYTYNSVDGEVSYVLFRTLADKCVWSDDVTVYCASPYEVPQGIYPDDWYKGKVSFSDDLWRLNTETNTAEIVYDAEAEGRHFDMIDLRINEAGNTLLFTDKKTLFLWSLAL